MARAAGSAATRADRSGFTLFELLVSLLILGVVLGAGIGAISSFDPTSHAARGVVANALRQARNDALAFGAPSRVAFEPEARTMRSTGFRVAGTWRFERGSLDGAGGHPAATEGFDVELDTPDGFIGDARDLTLGGAVARVEFDPTSDPGFRLDDGFLFTIAARPELGSGAGRILSFGDALTLDVQANGARDARIRMRGADELGRVREGEPVRLLSKAGALTPGRWSVVGVGHDGAALRLTVNGVTLAERAETRPASRKQGALTLGGGRRSFQGALDDLVVSVVRADSDVPLPSGAEFVARAPFEVRFDVQGRLDPVFHGGPVDVELEYSDGRRATVRISTAGTVL